MVSTPPYAGKSSTKVWFFGGEILLKRVQKSNSDEGKDAENVVYQTDNQSVDEDSHFGFGFVGVENHFIDQQ